MVLDPHVRSARLRRAVSHYDNKTGTVTVFRENRRFLRHELESLWRPINLRAMIDAGALEVYPKTSPRR